jgi:RHS repeat-associated protein
MAVPIYQKTSMGYAYYQNDHIGMPRMMITKNGITAWEGIYSSFGILREKKGTTTNSLRYPGQYFDMESGLMYNYHRYYTPSLGRYLQHDPAGMTAGDNVYVYAKNNTLLNIHKEDIGRGHPSSY